MPESKKIAVMTPIMPYPPDSGSRIRIFNLIKILNQQGFGICLFVFGTRPVQAHLDGLTPWCEDIQCVDPVAGRGNSPWFRKWIDSVSNQPFESRPEFRKILNRQISDWHPDVVQAEKTIGAAYLDLDRLKARGVRIVLEEGGVHHLAYERMARTSRRLWEKLLNRRRARRLKTYETHLIGKVDAVVAVSEDEAGLLRQMNSKARILLVPNGVDGRMLKQDMTPAGKRGISGFFCGDLSYYPNADAVHMIIEDLVPRIKDTPADMDFYIAGGHASKDLTARAQASGRVHLMGYVEDIQACFRQHAIFINPMRLGGGTRLKMLEAMAHGMTCVSTVTGAEGIDIVHGVHGWVADDMEGLAHGLCRLVSNRELMSALGGAARELIRDRYQWDACARELVDYYRT